jgi:hypothetical protein
MVCKCHTVTFRPEICVKMSIFKQKHRVSFHLFGEHLVDMHSCIPHI